METITTILTSFAFFAGMVAFHVAKEAIKARLNKKR
jgi:hypothetical protein